MVGAMEKKLLGLAGVISCCFSCSLVPCALILPKRGWFVSWGAAVQYFFNG
jgi:hypothetical protein